MVECAGIKFVIVVLSFFNCCSFFLSLSFIGSQVATRFADVALRLSQPKLVARAGGA